MVKANSRKAGRENRINPFQAFRFSCNMVALYQRDVLNAKLFLLTILTIEIHAPLILCLEFFSRSFLSFKSIAADYSSFTLLMIKSPDEKYCVLNLL